MKKLYLINRKYLRVHLQYSKGQYHAYQDTFGESKVLAGFNSFLRVTTRPNSKSYYFTVNLGFGRWKRFEFEICITKYM